MLFRLAVGHTSHIPAQQQSIEHVDIETNVLNMSGMAHHDKNMTH